MVRADKKGSDDGPTFIRSDDPPQEELPRTFVDDYADWAATVTDAPKQYHRATGVVMLSTLLTPYVYLETSYGEIKPNVWMMMLAGTTVTRKSTSMDLAMRMLEDVTDDFMLATDGSPEGLLAELSFRDGKVSLFHRDEITGFMSQVSGRDYLAGMLESFTRLYDGKKEKRILRRESIEINDPYLVFMAGGIKTKMQELVGMEHIRSGFLPRFFFVTGSTSADEIRPIGPPSLRERSNAGDSPRDMVISQLWRINQHYTAAANDDNQAVVKIAGITQLSVQGKPQRKNLTATDQAWHRIRQLKDQAIRLGEKSSAPELYTPLYDRLSNTVIKVAILLAGADLSNTIHIHHVQKAIYLSQEWLEAVTEFASAIEEAPEMDRWEKKMEKILVWLRAMHPQRVTQTEIMQKFRIRKRDIADIESTLIARNLIQVDPYPYRKDVPGTKIEWFVPSKDKPKPLSRVQREDDFRYGNEESAGHTHNGAAQRRIRFPISEAQDSED